MPSVWPNRETEMRIPFWLYITEADAIEAGMTHEGRMFGVPSWLRIDSEEQVTGSPKVPLLHVWCMFVDAVLEIGSWFVSSDNTVESPITVGRRIER